MTIEDDGLDTFAGDGGAMSGGEPEATSFPAPPAEAIDHLRRNPHLSSDFDAIFGSGAAAKHTGVGTSPLAREMHHTGELDAIAGAAQREQDTGGFIDALQRKWAESTQRYRERVFQPLIKSEIKPGGLMGEAGKLTPEERRAAGESEVETAKVVAPIVRGAQEAITAAKDYVPRISYPGAALRAAEGLAGAEAKRQEERIQTGEKALRGEAPLPEYAAWRSSLDKLAQTVASMPGHVAQFTGQVGGYAAEQLGYDDAALNNPVYKFGKDAEDYAKRLFPDDEARRYQFLTDVSQGVGSTVGMAGPGFMARVLGAGEKGVLATIAFMGAAEQVPEEFEKATKALKAGTATEWDRFINLMANTGFGATEAFGAAPMIAMPGKRGARQAMKRGLEGAAEEAGQEVFQTAGSNVAAMVTYDPTKDPYEDVLKSGVVAGVTGGAFGMATSRARAKAEAAEEEAKRREEERAKLVEDARQRIAELEGDMLPRGPDLPAMAKPVDRSAGEIAKAPTFQDALAAVPKDANGDPDVGALTDAIRQAGAQSWAALTPEQRQEVYRSFKPIEDAANTVMETLRQTMSQPKPTREEVAANRRRGWGPQVEEPYQAPDADLRQRFDQMLGGKTRRADWARALGATPEQVKALIDEAVKDGRLKMVRGQPVRTGKKAPAVQGGTTPTAQPSSAAGLWTKDPRVETAEALNRAVGRPLSAAAIKAIGISDRVGSGGIATGTEKFNAGNAFDKEAAAALKVMTPAQWAALPKHIRDDLKERAVFAQRINVLEQSAPTNIIEAAKQSGRLEIITVGDKPKAAPAAQPASLGEVRPGADRVSRFREQLATSGFKTIVEARKAAKDAGIPETGKALDELIEAQLVEIGREIARTAPSPGEAYQQLVALYDKQPNLGTRTSTSVANQAYSTPLPLAYLASRLADVAGSHVVYEPSAGNGALLIEADPATQTVYANELDQRRADALKAQGFRATTADATDPGLAAKIKAMEAAGAVIMNPPFGAVREGGRSKTWTIGQWETSQVDHAIAFRGLEAMADNGRAVLIVGGIKASSVEERRKGYRGAAKREFYTRLYGQYNVVDHFTVSGDLYRKQGAGWPVDVIVIDGRGKSARTLPAAAPPAIYDSWDALAEKLPDGQARDTTGGEAGAADRGIGQPAPGDAGGVEPTDGRGSGQPQPGTEDKPARVRGGRDRGEPATPRGVSVAPGVPEQPGRPRDAGAADQPAPPRQQRVKREPKGGQAQYEPASQATSLDTLIPVNMASAASAAMQRISAKHGSVDALVADRLGYAPEELSRYFSAEQVDALAAAIDNVERGAAFIIGDQTGIGKGRIVAGMLRYAIKRGLVPVLVTEKPDLYGDMYRDMRDIGLTEMLGNEPRMFMTNSGETVTLDETALEWKQEADAARAAGEKVPAKRGKFLAGGTSAKQQDDMRAILNGEDRYDVVFTTYDQMNTVKGQSTPRRNFLSQLGPRALIAFDESHNAGGAAKTGWESKNKPMNRADFAREIARTAQGVIFSSATYAKRPDVMDLYARTDMGNAVDDPKQLPDLIQRGGVPMQQIVATMLSDAGQYLRRERSFDGLEYAIEPVPVDADTYRQFSEAIRAVFRFDLSVKKVREDLMKDVLDAKGMAQSRDGGVGEGAAHTTAFSSLMHNIVNQMLLAIKAKATATRAIEAFKAGEKPVIALANTNESFIRDFAAQEDIAIGDAINLDFGDVLRRYLSRTLRITIKQAEGETEHHQIPVEDLPGHLQEMYRDAELMINGGEYAGLPISPIDAIRAELGRAGMKVAEVTGRQTMIDYSAKTPKYVQRPRGEQGPSGKRSSIAAFNAGRLDALILNRSGSTGVSMHASEKFKDQRRRRMILAQAEANIDTHLQMLGRVHRTGQVTPPAYSQIAAEIPAEARPTAVLMRKMASLNANTTGARGSVFMTESVDFMNEVGDKVVFDYLRDNPEIEMELGGDILKAGDDGNPISEDAAKRATGRLVLLTPEKQADFLEAVQQSYKDTIEELDALGENPLEAKTLDLQARTIETTTLKPATGEGPFMASSQIEKVSVKSAGRAMSVDDIAGDVAKSLGATKAEGDALEAMRDLAIAGREWSTKRITDLETRVEEWMQSAFADLEDEAKSKAIEKERAQLRRVTETLRLAYPGSRVSLTSQAGEETNGIVLSIERTGKAKSQTAGGAWTMVVAVPDSMRTMKLTLSKVFPPSSQMGPNDKGARLFRSDKSLTDLAQDFDRARLEGRETRYVVTGNILAGFDATGGKGRIVNFTAEDGTLRPGILMNRDFQVGRFMDQRAVRFKTGEQVAQFLDRATMTTVKGSDGNLAIAKRGETYVIQTPAARGTGGRYYTDPDVRDAIAPIEFTKMGNQMVARGLSRRQIVRAVDAIRGAGALLETTADQDIAQEIVAPTTQPQPARESPTPPPLTAEQIALSRKDRSYALNGNGFSDGMEHDRATRTLRVGRRYDVDKGVVEGMREALKGLPAIAPAEYKAGFLVAALPEPDGSVSAILERIDGSHVRIRLTIAQFDGARAFIDPATSTIGFFSFDLPLNFENRLVGELWHETIHALRKVGALDDVKFGDLVAHATNLRVLEMSYRSFKRALGDPQWEAFDDTVTIAENYMRAYSRMSPAALREAMNQEAVAHMTELLVAGVPLPLPENIRAIYADIETGKLGGQEQGIEIDGDEVKYRLGHYLWRTSLDNLAEQNGATLISKVRPWQSHPGPVLAFHGTTAAEQFTRFDLSRAVDLGIHFGTAEHANKFAAGKTFRGEATERAGRVFPVVLNVRNPITMPDMGDWMPAEVIRELGKQGIKIPHNVRVVAERQRRGPRFEADLARGNAALRAELFRQGYDGIRYLNKGERIGLGWSYIVWERGAAQSALNDDVLFALRRYDPTAGRWVERSGTTPEAAAKWSAILDDLPVDPAEVRRLANLKAGRYFTRSAVAEREHVARLAQHYDAVPIGEITNTADDPERVVAYETTRAPDGSLVFGRRTDEDEGPLFAFGGSYPSGVSVERDTNSMGQTNYKINLKAHWYNRTRTIGEAYVRDLGDSVQVGRISIADDYQRAGIATALYAQIERDLGKPLVPDSTLSEKAHAFWMKHRPEAVDGKYNPPIDGGNFWTRKPLYDLAQSSEVADTTAPILEQIAALVRERENGGGPMFAFADKDEPFTGPMRVYHGTSTPKRFDAFNRPPWMTESPEVASGAAYYETPAEIRHIVPENLHFPEGRVFPLDINPQNPFVVRKGEMPDQAFRRYGYGEYAGADPHAAAAAKGHDFFIYDGIGEDFGVRKVHRQIVPLQPNSVRSATTGSTMFALSGRPSILNVGRTVTLDAEPSAEPAAYREALRTAGVELPDLPSIEAMQNVLTEHGVGAVRFPDGKGGWSYSVWNQTNVVTDPDAQMERDILRAKGEAAAIMDAEDLHAVAMPGGVISRDGGVRASVRVAMYWPKRTLARVKRWLYEKMTGETRRDYFGDRGPAWQNRATKATNHVDGATVYRGTYGSYDIGPNADGVVWFSPDARIADLYARIGVQPDLGYLEGARIYKGELRFTNPLVIDAKFAKMADSIDMVGQQFGLVGVPWKAQFDAARRAGHDGIIFNNMRDIGGIETQYAALVPGTILSDTTNGPMFAFAGEKARTADLDALAKAKKMEADGHDAETVWMTTGWWRGPDEKWRFEIDDSTAVLTPDAVAVFKRGIDTVGQLSGGWGYLEDVMDHPSVYTAYPAMAASIAGVRRGLGNQGSALGLDERMGQFDPAEDRLVTVAYGPGWGRRIMLHEMQHAIQFEEGFAAGSSPDEAAVDLQAIDQRAATKSSEEILADDVLADRAYGLYRRSAGEAEARLVERRRNMTPEQRKARAPWLDYDVDPEDQIVRFDGKAQAMRPIERTTRLYRGEPANAAGGLGHHYTRSLDRARGFAGADGKVYMVEVPIERMGELKPSRAVGNFIVPRDIRETRMEVSDGSEVMFALADAATGRSMRRDLDALGYYSQALEAARGLKQAKGTPEQMLAQLKSAGVKDAEIEATGLRAALDGKKSVTRDEIVAHLESNRVGMSEVKYGEKPDNITAIRQRRDELQEAYDAIPWEVGVPLRERVADALGVMNTGSRSTADGWLASQRGARGLSDELNREIDAYMAKRFEAKEALRSASNQLRAAEEPNTKFSNYSLDPSNPTYRETVLHLPESPFEDLINSSRDAYREVGRLEDAGRTGTQEYEAAVRRYEALSQNLSGKDKTAYQTAFRSGHFPEPNIVGHMMTSMVKHEGKPVYLIDQIQSDWGQKLRDGGVRDEAKIKEIARALDGARAAQKSAFDDANEFVSIHLGKREPTQDFIKLSVALNHVNDRPLKSWENWDGAPKFYADDVRAQANELKRKINPSEVNRLQAELATAEAAASGNPLVNTTDQWVNTTLRRALRQAAEADAKMMGVPDGATVEGYNQQGDSAGNAYFYEKIVAKNLLKLLTKIDSSIKPIRVDQLETPSGMKGSGFTLFPLTDAVRQSVIDDGQPLFSFGGVRAKTADHKALAKAKDMEVEGRARDDIWTETGWFRGVDGEWRFEIDDSRSPYWGPTEVDLNGDGSARGRLANWYQHRALYGAYPDLLSEMLYVARPGHTNHMLPDEAAGGWKRGVGVYAQVGGKHHVRSILGHETQHAVQELEGYARGGSTDAFSPDDIAAERSRLNAESGDGWTSVGTYDPSISDEQIAAGLYYRLAGEVEARTVQKRMQYTPEQRKAVPPWQDYDVPEDQQIVRRGADGPMFALDRRRSNDSLDAIIEKLTETVGITITQGLRGMSTTRGGTTANVRPGDGKDRGRTADGRPRQRFGNTWIGATRILGQYDNYSGVARMRSVRQIDQIAHEAAHHLERLFGAEMLNLQQQHLGELSSLTVPGMAETPSEQWAEFFRLYVMNPAAARLAAPGLYQSFEDMVEAEMPGMLEQFGQLHDMLDRYNARTPLDRVAADLVATKHRSIVERTYGSYRDGTLAGDISVGLSRMYTAIYDRLNPIWHLTRAMLEVADRNGVRGPDGKPLSLRVTENPYKLMRAFAGSYKKGHNWLTRGIRDPQNDQDVAPALRDALMKVFGGETGIASTGAAAAGAVAGGVVGGPIGAIAGGTVGSAIYGKASDMMRGTGWDAKRYQDFNAYIFAIAARERYDQYEKKMQAVADVNQALTDAAAARPGIAAQARKDAATLERRQTAMVRLETLLRDRRSAAGVADTVLRNTARKLDEKKDNQLAAQMARDETLADRRGVTVRDTERDQSRAVKDATAAQEQLADLEIQHTMLAAEIEQLQQIADVSADRLSSLDGMVEQLKAAKKRELGAGIHRPPVLETQDQLERTIAEAEAKYPQFPEAARIFHEYVHGLLVMEYRAGFHTDEEFQALAKNSAWYAPLMRDMSDIREAKRQGQGGRSWSPHQALKGSDRAAINPVDIIIERSYQLARKTAYDAAVKSIVDLTRAVGPGHGAIAEEVSREETQAANQAAFDRILANATALGLDETEAKQLLHLMEHETTGSDLQFVFSPATKGPKPGIRIPYWEDGERKMLQINDADFAEEIFNAVNGIGEDLNNMVVKAIAAPSRALSFGVTAHPAFALVNMGRDMMAAWITTGALPLVTQAKGIAMELGTHKLFDSDLWRQWSPAWMQRKIDEWQEFVRRYHDAGGIRGGQFTATLGDVRDKGDWRGLRDTGFHVSVSRIWDFIELSETSTRLGVARAAYKRAKAFDPTLSETEAVAEAAFTARDVLDFDRRGSKMGIMTKLVAFMNPNLQGMDKAIRTAVGAGDRGSAIKKKLQIVFKRNAGIQLSAAEERDLVDAYKFTVRLMVFNAAIVALYMLHAGDPEEEAINDRMKPTHAMVDIANFMANMQNSAFGRALGFPQAEVNAEKKWKRLPLPFELATPALIWTWAMRTHRDKDPQAYTRLFDSLYDLLAPPVIPQAVKVIAEPSFNYSTFTGRPIVSADMQKMPTAERYEWFTSSIAKRVGRALDVAPVKVDYVITNGLGYIGREIQRFGEWVLPEGKVRPGQDVPLLEKRIQADPYRGSNEMTEFYKQMKPDGGGGGPASVIKGLIVDEGTQYVQAAAAYKRIIDEQNPLAAKAWLAKQPEEMQAYAYLQAHFSTAMQKMHPMNRLDAIVQVVNRMQREIVNGDLKEAIGARRRRNVTLESLLKPDPQEEEVLLDILRRVNVTEARNTFIAIGHGRWKGAAERLPIDLVLDELNAANPKVYEELMKRISLTKVPALDDAARAWRAAKPELLREQENATLGDATAALSGAPQIGTRDERRPAKVRAPAR